MIRVPKMFREMFGVYQPGLVVCAVTASSQWLTTASTELL